VQLAPALPQFVSQPQNATNSLDASVTFTANALGAVMTNSPLDLRYQWYKSPATPVLNATNAAFTLTSLAFADAGSYYLVVTNRYGSGQSSNATVVVLPPAAPLYSAHVDPGMAYVTNFEGWGTSLAWWANVAGGFSNRATYADLAFTQLKLNIVRYNIGGGENPNIANTLQFRARVPGFQPSPGVWNWAADANQRWMLKAAVARGANRVVANANSPPWWMTVSGSVTGSTNGTSDNLRTTSETDFAIYLATVISNLTVLDDVTFDFATPLNEPNSSWWQLGGGQEGCPMSTAQQARMVDALKTELSARGLPQGIVGSEDLDPGRTVSSLNGYSASARSNLALVATHTYNANNAAGVRRLAHSLGKDLWMSEYGDSDASGLTMARRIRNDLATMWARAWVYWQVVDNFGGWGMLLNPLDGSGNSSYTVNRKFYVMGQFSQFIRPGCQLVSVGDTNSLAAYTASNRTLVIVALNDTTNSYSVNYDLSSFVSLPSQAARHRTSPTENLLAIPALGLAGQQLTSYLAAQSVTTHVLTNVIPASPSTLPLAWYPLEGNAQDESGHGHAGTVSGNVTFVPGRLGAQAAQFDGTSGYIQIPRSVSNHFTIALWMKTTATGGAGQWSAGKGLVDGAVSGAAEDFGVALVGDKAAFGVGNPDTTITSVTAINDGQWHHVAATRDAVSGQMKIYVDGSLQATALGPNGTKNSPANLRLGSIRSGTVGGFLSGTIDDVQIFGRTLSADEIPRLMNHAPALAAISNATVLAGRTLLVTNSASDPDLPAQTLSWSLLNPPDGAAINTINGLVTWRPGISQSPATNLLAVVVADDGIPSMSATQSFAVMLLRPAQPQMLMSSLSSGSFRLSVNGDAGPDYTIETATNLTPVVLWTPVFTNLSATPPFLWTNTDAINDPQRFYRVRLSP
jgi:O-glycosyl hydrolase